MINALEGIRINARPTMEMLEKLNTDLRSFRDQIEANLATHKRGIEDTVTRIQLLCERTCVFLFDINYSTVPIVL